MIKETQDRGIGMVICGFLLVMAVRAWGPSLPIPRQLIAILFICAFVGGLVLSLWGCAQIARARGYSLAFGVLGILSLVGMVAVLLFPDRLKQTAINPDNGPTGKP